MSRPLNHVANPWRRQIPHDKLNAFIVNCKAMRCRTDHVEVLQLPDNCPIALRWPNVGAFDDRGQDAQVIVDHLTPVTLPDTEART